MSRLRGRVARRRRNTFDRSAQALVEPEVGAATWKRARDLLPARGRLPREIGVGEEALNRDWPEALGGMEHEDRHVAREQRGERRRRSVAPSGARCEGQRKRNDRGREAGKHLHNPSMREVTAALLTGAALKRCTRTARRPGGALRDARAEEHGPELVGRKRPREEEALRVVAAERT